ncbi:hypothetical protein [Synechococcus elongatus]|uniref:Glycosyltransferase RgtA/B/C/D-like domain-containing protein n=1 Tax=Synechococcus elongatus PCC 11801 TaxID=2219813 RepID=A0AAQ3MAR0_SYNEL
MSVSAKESISFINSIKWLIATFLLWRLALFIVAFTGLSLSIEYPGTYDHNSHWVYFENNYILNGFFRWDADWYDLIAREGYFNGQDERKGNTTAFFPLFPLLSRWLSHVFSSHLIAGLVISNVSLLLALGICYRIGVKFYKEQIVQRSIILILSFPGSFFFSTYYTEGLYFFLTSASLLYYFRDNYLASGCFGFLASLTRPTGVSLIIAMAISSAFQKILGKKTIKPSISFLLLIPLGLLTYMAFLYIYTGNAFIFSTSQVYWGRSFNFPLLSLIQSIKEINFSLPRDMNNTQILVNSFCAFLFLGSGAWMLIKNLKSQENITLPLWVLIGVLFPLSTGSTDSMVRFCSVLFPVFFMLAASLKKEVHYAWLISFFSALQAVYLLGFMNKFWVV